MAGRTSTSVGVAATMVILGILCLTFFVLTAVFFGKFNDQQRMVQQLQADQAEIIRADERRSDTVRLLVQNAKAAGNKSLVTFMTDSMGQVMERVTGNRRDGLAELNRKLEGVSGADTGSLLSVIARVISTLLVAGQPCSGPKPAPPGPGRPEERRRPHQTHRRQPPAPSTPSARFCHAADREYRAREDYKSRVDQTLGRERTDFAETRRRLETQLAKVTDEKIILENQLAVLRGQKNLEAFRGRPKSLRRRRDHPDRRASRTVNLSIGAREGRPGHDLRRYRQERHHPRRRGPLPPARPPSRSSRRQASSTARITSSALARRPRRCHRQRHLRPQLGLQVCRLRQLRLQPRPPRHRPRTPGYRNHDRQLGRPRRPGPLGRG